MTASIENETVTNVAGNSLSAHVVLSRHDHISGKIEVELLRCMLYMHGLQAGAATHCTCGSILRASRAIQMRYRSDLRPVKGCSDTALYH